MDPLSLVSAAAAQNNEWSAAQAQKQMDFQERMSNTAHQREIADLKAAGLNPVLSARLGGASTPSGAAGTVDTSLTSSIVELLKEFGEGMMSSAVHAAASSGRAGRSSDPSSASSVLSTVGSYGDKDKFNSDPEYFKVDPYAFPEDKKSFKLNYQTVNGAAKIAAGILTGNQAMTTSGLVQAGTGIGSKGLPSKSQVAAVLLNAVLPGRTIGRDQKIVDKVFR